MANNVAGSTHSIQAHLPGFEEAKPFLKWAGGKRQLLRELLRRVPPRFNAYHEPFLGGGALYFALSPRTAILSDTNCRLIRAYSGVRDDAPSVVELLSKMPNNPEFFDMQRKRDVDTDSDIGVAAWMIYLNRTAYNGLYRVNKQGRFNVPYGRYRKPRICDTSNLQSCSSALASTELLAADFEYVRERATPGDFVYFDPPYVPISRHSSFTRYTADCFDLEDHRRLRDVAVTLKRRGVHVMVSNSAADEVFDLYGADFHIDVISATRFINSKSQGRGRIPETIAQ